MRHEQPGAFGTPEGQWAAGVFIETPTRVVVVSEDVGIVPVLMKIAGGRRRQTDETVEDTAVREAFEETGIKITKEELGKPAAFDRKGHTYFLFHVKVDEARLEGRYTVAKNGEQVHVLTHAELRAKEADVLGHHRAMLRTRCLWPA